MIFIFFLLFYFQEWLLSRLSGVASKKIYMPSVICYPGRMNTSMIWKLAFVCVLASISLWYLCSIFPYSRKVNMEEKAIYTNVFGSVSKGVGPKIPSITLKPPKTAQCQIKTVRGLTAILRHISPKSAAWGGDAAGGLQIPISRNYSNSKGNLKRAALVARCIILQILEQQYQWVFLLASIPWDTQPIP